MPNFKMMRLSITNCYLLQLSKGYMLIDCGSPYDKSGFISKMKKLGLTTSVIRYLLLTHHHSDHCGLLSFLTAENPDIRVIMSRKCSEFLTSGANHRTESEQYANRLLGFITDIYSRLNRNLSQNFPPYFTRSQDIIIDSDSRAILSHMDLECSIIMTPGHTEDSISIVSGDSAFVGDAARNILNFTGKPYQPMLLDNPKTVFTSWKKLADMNTTTIFPSHGRPFNIDKLKIKTGYFDKL